jgi:hypothetical protein
LIFVFLIFTALHEGLPSAVLKIMLRDMPNSKYFQNDVTT